jgi:nucleotide-binding universal stress UspA family protein
MLQIRTVLCPIGFDDLDQTELGLAADVCRSFGARLILLHNLGSAPPGASMSWMWQQEHRTAGSTEEEAIERLRSLLTTLPPGVEAEAHLCNGIAAPTILEMGEMTGADLLVMATHGASTEDHASVAEQIVERSRCPVLVQRAGSPLPVRPLQPVAGAAPWTLLVATDFSSSSERAVAYGLDLARALPVQMHLLHVIRPVRPGLVEPAAFGVVPEDTTDAQLTYTRLRLRTLVPFDLEGKVTLHAEVGDPASKISEVAERIGASYLMMGAHARSLLRRIFTHDTSRDLLHHSPCPVWFVPEVRAA